MRLSNSQRRRMSPPPNRAEPSPAARSWSSNQLTKWQGGREAGRQLAGWRVGCQASLWARFNKAQPSDGLSVCFFVCLSVSVKMNGNKNGQNQTRLHMPFVQFIQRCVRASSIQSTERRVIRKLVAVADAASAASWQKATLANSDLWVHQENVETAMRGDFRLFGSGDNGDKVKQIPSFL